MVYSFGIGCPPLGLPRFIDIQDVRLGVSNRVLQAAVMVYFILIMSISKEYGIKYTPKGFNQYYISAGTMYTDQDSSYWNDICANAGNGDYDYSILIATLVIPSGEKDIGCYSPTSYESNIKIGKNAWIFTYEKDTHIIKDSYAVLIRDSLYCDSTYSSSYNFKERIWRQPVRL